MTGKSWMGVVVAVYGCLAMLGLLTGDYAITVWAFAEGLLMWCIPERKEDDNWWEF
jgi:hypothetical protein